MVGSVICFYVVFDLWPYLFEVKALVIFFYSYLTSHSIRLAMPYLSAQSNKHTARLDSADGQRGWAARMGSAGGQRGWVARMGSVGAWVGNPAAESRKLPYPIALGPLPQNPDFSIGALTRAKSTFFL